MYTCCLLTSKLHILPATRMEWSFSLCKCKQLEHYIREAVFIFIDPVVASSPWSLFCFSSIITNLFDSSWNVRPLLGYSPSTCLNNWKAPSPFLVLVQLASSTYADESIVQIRSNLECLFMTYILGFAVNVTERATWPFCDMRRRHSFKVFKERALDRNPVCFERRARRGALRPFDTSLFLASETMQFASGRDTNPREFALLTSTGPFAVSFICLWSIRASLSSEAYLTNWQKEIYPPPNKAAFHRCHISNMWEQKQNQLEFMKLQTTSPNGNLTILTGIRFRRARPVW